MAEGMFRSAVLADEPSWQERVDAYRVALADWTNFQLALEHCAEHDDAESGLRLCNAMRVVWVMMGDQSSPGWLDRFLRQASNVAPQIRSAALVARAEIAFEQQDHAALETYSAAGLEASLSCPGANLAGAHRMRALAALMAGRVPEAGEHIAAAIATAREAADRWEEGTALTVWATVTLGQGDMAAARLIYTEALAALGESRGWMAARAHHGLGRVALACGDRAEAMLHFGDSLRLYRQVGARMQMARCLATIGQVALEAGDLTTARSDLTECMKLSLLTGQRKDIADGLAALARLAVASGDTATGVRLSGTAKTLFEAIGTPGFAEVAGLDALIDAAQAQLGPERVAKLLADGRGLSAHQAVASLISSPCEEIRTGEQPPWPGPLTDREREVALLVAEGLSNRAIGDKLFITPATVARHMANIFGKLGFSSRAQLIAWVVSSNPAS
jgi:ATP/maltotriose-dependent transcriptional regulator MalT